MISAFYAYRRVQRRLAARTGFAAPQKCAARPVQNQIPFRLRHQRPAVEGDKSIVCTTRLKTQMPSLQIIMLTVYKDHDLTFQALKAGACGYLLKRSGREEILKAIADVRTGGAPMTGKSARMLVETFQKPPPKQPEAGLSPREMDVLIVVAQGLTNKEIASRLNLGFKTLRNHLRHVYENFTSAAAPKRPYGLSDVPGFSKPRGA